jgi:hypothetical protein
MYKPAAISLKIINRVAMFLCVTRTEFLNRRMPCLKGFEINNVLKDIAVMLCSLLQNLGDEIRENEMCGTGIRA